MRPKSSPNKRDLTHHSSGGKKSKSQTVLKRYIKFLSVCNNPNISKKILKAAPDSVVKSIANAALNAKYGEIRLKPADKKLFARNPRLFKTLTSKSTSVKSKRSAIISQKGNGIIAPLLIAALTTLGSLFLTKK